MPEQSISQIAADSYRFIQDTILEPLGWGEFDALFATYAHRRGHSYTAYIDSLPLLAYRAAGGESEDAFPVSSAWILHILAGRVLDDLADDQGKQSVWQQNGRATALSYALFAMGAANTALAYIQKELVYREISQKFNQALALAAKVQQKTSDSANPSVEDYFKAIAAKTGMVFALGTWAGGYMATSEHGAHERCSPEHGSHESSPQTCEALYSYGLNTGMMLQIVDDYTDLAEDLVRGEWTLPVLHALAQLEDERRPALIADLNSARGQCPDQIQEVVAQVNELGSLTWSLQVAGAYQQRAIAALDQFPTENKIHLVAYVSQQYSESTL
ncbi:MAG: hypothetical protein CL608_26130 [Anaerolineaceae bacterium]|nr:hypothetical protein [Anaerolineaceae bacterium]